MPQRNERAELATAVMELIDRGHRGISRHLDLTRVRVLGLVVAHGPIRPGAIAARLDLTASAVSRHLAALEAAGQVVTEPDPADSRTFLVRRTEDGSADVDATLAAGTAAFTGVLADWSDAEIGTALAVITRLNDAWANRSPSAPAPGGPRWRRNRFPSADQEDSP